jgi:hypothetical protein
VCRRIAEREQPDRIGAQRRIPGGVLRRAGGARQKRRGVRWKACRRQAAQGCAADAGVCALEQCQQQILSKIGMRPTVARGTPPRTEALRETVEGGGLPPLFLTGVGHELPEV